MSSSFPNDIELEYNHWDTFQVYEDHINYCEVIFRISSISIVQQPSYHYSRNRNENQQEILMVVDGHRYKLIAEEKEISKIYNKIMRAVFPPPDKKNKKKYI